MNIELFIPGRPIPGGSKTATLIRRKGGEIVMKNGRPLITTRDAAKGNAEWKATVAFFARQAYTGSPLEGPLAVRFDFFVTRPKGHFRTNGQVRDSAPPYPAVKPDGLKLTRAAEDALTNIVWKDDALIVEHQITKRYAVNPGVKITVAELVKAEPVQTEAVLWQP